MASNEPVSTNSPEPSDNDAKDTLSADVESQVSSIRASRRRKSFNWSIVLVPLVFVIGVMIGYFGQTALASVLPGTPASQTSTSGGKPDVVDLLVSQTRHFKGNKNAPVTMIEFSDFQ